MIALEEFLGFEAGPIFHPAWGSTMPAGVALSEPTVPWSQRDAPSAARSGWFTSVTSRFGKRCRYTWLSQPAFKWGIIFGRGQSSRSVTVAARFIYQLDTVPLLLMDLAWQRFGVHLVTATGWCAVRRCDQLISSPLEWFNSGLDSAGGSP